MSIIGLLNTENYQIYNRVVARELDSIYAAILLSELINRKEYHEERNHEFLSHDDKLWFYYTVDKCKERTDFGVKMQTTAFKKLKEKGLIEICRKGLLAKRYVYLNEEKIMDMIRGSKSRYRSAQGTELDTAQGTDLDQAQRKNSPIYKNPSKEPYKEKKGGKPPNPLRAPNVRTSDDEHKRLSEEFTEPIRDKAYKRLSDYKANTEKKKWKKHDNLSIRSWVIGAVHDDEVKRKNFKQSDDSLSQYSDRWE